MKSFNAEEREIIRRKLLECCEECWSKYGYKKTNIRELCEAAGISTGAFYMFFTSKEHLFFETAQHVGDRIGAIVYEEMPQNPTKYDFSRALKKMFREFSKVEWYLRREDEFSVIVRKLPKDYMANASNKDMADLGEIIKKYKLIPKLEMGKIIHIMSLLAMSTLNKKMLGDGYDEAFGFLLDITVEKIFR